MRQVHTRQIFLGPGLRRVNGGRSWLLANSVRNRLLGGSKVSTKRARLIRPTIHLTVYGVWMAEYMGLSGSIDTQ